MSHFPQKPKVGDVLWLETPVSYITSGEVTVMKVGRRWAYVDGHYLAQRFDIKTGAIGDDEYNSWGRVYPNRGIVLMQQRRTELWTRFKRDVGRLSIGDLTAIDILKAAKALGIELNEGKS